MGLTKTDVLQHTMLLRYQQWYWSGIDNDVALCIPETFISGYSHTHDIHTTPIGIIEHRIQTACVHECQGLEGWFHKDRGEGQ